MKKWIVTLIVLVSFGIAHSQTSLKRSHINYDNLISASVQDESKSTVKSLNVNELISEDFSSNYFPPPGWAIDKHPENWLRNNTSNAGGTAPEASFSCCLNFNDTSRLISPFINTQGFSMLFLQFTHKIYGQRTGNIIGVATRSKDHDWTSVWSRSVQETIPAEDALVFISNSDTGQPDFQFCFYFLGNSANLDQWYIDDVKLSKALEHDVSLSTVMEKKQFEAGTSYAAKIKIKNCGKSSESLSVQCRIANYYGTVLFTNTKTLSNFVTGTSEAVVFDPFVLPENEMLKVEITAQLADDQNPEDNISSKYINTYTANRDLVLVEIGTGTWCGFCPGASMGAEDLLKNGKKVGVVEYHISDKFETAEARSRALGYYGITGLPTAVFDGTSYMIGGYHSESMYPNYYLPIYNDLCKVKTPLSIHIYGSPEDSDSYNLSVQIKKLAPFNSDSARLFVALTESDIDFPWQDQAKVNFAERLLLPNDSGAYIDMKDDSIQTIPISFKVQRDWKISNIELVAWVQDINLREVLNASKVKLENLQVFPEITFAAEKCSKTDTLGKEIVFDIKLKNNSDKEQTCFLVRKKNDLPQNWTSALCFGNNCFAPFIDSVATTAEFNSAPLQPNESRDVSLHVFSEITSGTANVTLEAGTMRNPANRIKLDLTASTITTMVGTDGQRISEYSISQNYPNPFNPSTVISYKLPFASNVKLRVYNLLGQEVKVLADGIKHAGMHEVKFNVPELSSGIYIYSIEAVSIEDNHIFRDTKKMIIAK